MKKYMWITIEVANKERFFLKCQEKQIAILEVQQEKKSLQIKIQKEDYSKLKKIWFIKIVKTQALGWDAGREKLRQYHIFICALVIGAILLYFCSHLMLSVTVIHSKEEIRSLVLNALESRGVKKNSWRKEFGELEEIKNEILEMYPNDLEWMEIETHGMNYVVRVVERKLEEETEEPTACNIVAIKDGIIKEMVYSQGEKMFSQNDAVKKGDILISGSIKKDEETKNTVCATGEVYAEVWYQVSASVPMTYENFERTDKVRWNIKLKNNGYDDFLFKSRLENCEEEKHPLLTIFGTEVSFVKQYETLKSTVTLTEEEALNKALEAALEKVKMTLDEKEEIIAKKVLKKEVNNSTMNIEVFVSVLEQIGERQEFVVEE